MWEMWPWAWGWMKVRLSSTCHSLHMLDTTYFSMAQQTSCREHTQWNTHTRSRWSTLVQAIKLHYKWFDLSFGHELKVCSLVICIVCVDISLTCTELATQCVTPESHRHTEVDCIIYSLMSTFIHSHIHCYHSCHSWEDCCNSVRLKVSLTFPFFDIQLHITKTNQ